VIAQHAEHLEALLVLHSYAREEEAVIYDPMGRTMYVVWAVKAVRTEASSRATTLHAR
jgi:hypothetical protein